MATWCQDVIFSDVSVKDFEAVLPGHDVVFSVVSVKDFEAVLPGNDVVFSDVSIKDFEAVSSWCQKQGVTLVLVGPEDPLAAGISDHLAKKGGLS